MRKKMIEVAIPLDAINQESAREKNIRHGHPSTLHLWWARRPLAACRAVIFSSLVDDPESDPANRDDDGNLDEQRTQRRREELFALISELVKWDNSRNREVINRSRAEIASSYASAKVHDSKEWAADALLCGEPIENYLNRTAKPAAVDSFLAEHLPPVLDPFCGGGSIPLEAQRLGLRAYATDLNPVPVLINKALLELPQRFAGLPPLTQGRSSSPEIGPSKRKRATQSAFAERVWTGATGLAADVRFYGKWMRDEAEKRIGHLYPKVSITPQLVKLQPDLAHFEGQALPTIAWLWARNTLCPNPACGVRSPLCRSFTIYSRGKNRVWVDASIGSDGVVRPIVRSVGVPPAGSVGRRGATCVACGAPIELDHIRDEGQADRLGMTLLAVVADAGRERVYVTPTEEHVEAATQANPSWVPDTALPEKGLGFRVQRYGLVRHSMLHTARQLCTLSALTDLIGEIHERVSHDLADGAISREGYADAIVTYLAMAIDKTAARNNALCLWEAGMGRLAHGFGMQTVSMKWDFAETHPFAGAGGDFYGAVESLAEVLEALPEGVPGWVQQADAASPKPTATKVCISTDPPYYDNIGYADLSDLFYVWLRRSLGRYYPELLGTVLTPKQDELIADDHRQGGKENARHFFEQGLGRAFAEMRAQQCGDLPTTVFYAFKQSEVDEDSESDGEIQQASTGWETMLEGLLRAGFMITGTWPMRTEQPSRMRDKGANALASSIVLVCRPRPVDAAMTSRRDFVALLKRDLPSALRNLQKGNIAPVDLAQAAIGPGIAVYSQYAKVLDSSGDRLSVRTALTLINQVLDEVLAEQEGDYDADTRWSLKWFEQFAHDDGPFGDANTLATAMSIGINGLVETGIVQAKAGKVRLLKRTELMNGHPEAWDPATDTDIVHWEVCQYLIHALDTKGEAGAAALLRRINARYPGASETARELAYRLYTICERKKWAQEAMAYNSLIVAWPEIVKLAQSSDGSGGEAQTTMF
jgi:putative DNA methylase